jgi:TRAP-type uncharacterized transport system fused permease subunit
VYGPPLLLQGSPLEVGTALVTGMAGVTALAAAMVGFGRRPLKLWERAILASAAVALIFPGLYTDAYGMIVLVALMWRGPRGAATAEGVLT